MTKLKKPVWGAFVNLNGLYSQKPLRGYWNKNLECWWGDKGEIEFNMLGVEIRGAVTSFASYNKKDVEVFIEGAKSIQMILKNLLP